MEFQRNGELNCRWRCCLMKNSSLSSSRVLHDTPDALLFRSSTMSVNKQAPTRWFMLMPIHVENEEARRRESSCDHSMWYINARVSVRVNSQRGKNVKCSSFTRRCVVINNNGRVNYCVRAGDVRTITGHDSHENRSIKVTGAITLRRHLENFISSY